MLVFGSAWNIWNNDLTMSVSPPFRCDVLALRGTVRKRPLGSSTTRGQDLNEVRSALVLLFILMLLLKSIVFIDERATHFVVRNAR